MLAHIRANLWLLVLTVLICSVLYPLVLLGIGQSVFRHQAQGSLIDDKGNPTTDPAKARGSLLIAQPFKGEEYFQPRPSNAGSGYDASASSGSNLAASNPLLRSRVAKQLGPMVKYAANSPTKPGQLVGKDIEVWFQTQAQMDPNFVTSLAESWVSDKKAAVALWLNEPEEKVKDDTGKAAKVFFDDFIKKHPGTWPTVEDQTIEDKVTKEKKTVKVIKPVTDGSDIQAYFFDQWLQAHRDAFQKGTMILEKVPADMVMSSGSGLDPHITLKNAQYQLRNRVAEKQAQKVLDANPTVAKLLEEAKAEVDETKRKPIEEKIETARATVGQRIEKKLGKSLEKRVTKENVEKLLQKKKTAPLGGMVGVDLVNVLEVNLAMDAQREQLIGEVQ